MIGGVLHFGNYKGKLYLWVINGNYSGISYHCNKKTSILS